MHFVALSLLVGCASVTKSVWESTPQGRYEAHMARQAARDAKDRQRGEEREEKRKAEHRRDEEAAAATAAQTEEERAPIKAKAKTAGYEAVDFAHGLTGVILGIRDGGLSMETAKLVAIHLGDVDDYLVAFQVIDQNNVLFRHDEITVWLKNHKRDGSNVTWLEGARITASDFRYFAITGVRKYNTILGSKQAVMVEVAF